MSERAATLLAEALSLSDDLETRFVDALRAAVIRIETAPHLGSSIRGSYRWVRTRRFPYVLDDRILSPGVEMVYSVAHKRRRPSYWMRRVRRS